MFEDKDEVVETLKFLKEIFDVDNDHITKDRLKINTLKRIVSDNVHIDRLLMAIDRVSKNNMVDMNDILTLVNKGHLSLLEGDDDITYITECKYLLDGNSSMLSHTRVIATIKTTHIDPLRSIIGNAINTVYIMDVIDRLEENGIDVDVNNYNIVGSMFTDLNLCSLGMDDAGLLNLDEALHTLFSSFDLLPDMILTGAYSENDVRRAKNIIAYVKYTPESILKIFACLNYLLDEFDRKEQ